MTDYYMLIDEEVVKAESIDDWLRWSHLFDDKKIIDTKILGHRVSTIFLTIDHRSYMEEGPPVLFETMVFKLNSNTGVYCERYTSLQVAKDRHQWIIDNIDEIIEGNKNDNNE